MTVSVRLAEVLRPYADGATVVALDCPDSATIGAVLDALDAQHPGVGRRVRDEGGAVRTHVNVFVGPDNVRDLDGLSTVVPAGVEVAVLPAVSGG
jgi:sulfur-carrier protein